MIIGALLVAAGLLSSPYGTVKAVSGVVKLRTHGVVAVLSQHSVGKALLDGDSVMVALHSTLVVKLQRGGMHTFTPSTVWQPLLSPLPAADAAAYKALQTAFDAALIRRAAFRFPSGQPVPCTLFTIAPQRGPYKVTAGDDVLFDGPVLNHRAIVKALLAARDVRHLASITIAAGGRKPYEAYLMPHDQEADLLSALGAADECKAGDAHHLARAVAFSHYGLFEFALYELKQMHRRPPQAVLASASEIVAVRPPRS
ncbi:MAG: hypothetical protein ACYC96_02735 [Fimbriimonadaceae bacterium]